MKTKLVAVGSVVILSLTLGVGVASARRGPNPVPPQPTGGFGYRLTERVNQYAPQDGTGYGAANAVGRADKSAAGLGIRQASFIDLNGDGICDYQQ
jgi:hypothetical protein